MRKFLVLDMDWDGCTRFLCVEECGFLTRICEASEILQSCGCEFEVVSACEVRISLFWDSIVVVVLKSIWPANLTVRTRRLSKCQTCRPRKRLVFV